jgi:hypothetical protein
LLGAPAFWPWREVLRILGATEPAVGEVESPQDRFRAVDAVAGAVLTEVARRPLIVVLDDVHWADETSLLVLRHLADRAPDAPLLLVAALREPEPGAAAARALAGLERAPACEGLHLRGLGPADVGRQLDALGATGAAVDEVHDATGGNPFFVREVARAVVDGTWTPGWASRSVRDAVAARVERLGPDARRLVEAGAVVGRRFPLAVAAGMLGADLQDCPRAADEAVASGLLGRVGARGELLRPGRADARARRPRPGPARRRRRRPGERGPAQRRRRGADVPRRGLPPPRRRAGSPRRTR